MQLPNFPHSPDGATPRPRRGLPNPARPPRGRVTVQSAPPTAAPKPATVPTFAPLREGGFTAGDLDRLRLILRYEEPVLVAALLGVHPGHAARSHRRLLERARRILLAATLREALGVGGQAVIDVGSGEQCDDLRPDELEPTGPVRASGLRLATLARAVRRVESDRNDRGLYLCAVRVPGGCRLWSGLLRCEWILPFTPPKVAGDAEPVLLPVRRGA